MPGKKNKVTGNAEVSKGKKKTAVKKVSLDNMINEIKTTEEQEPEIVDLLDEDDESFKWGNVFNEDPGKNYTPKEVMELLDSKLKNQAQKNVLRHALNAINAGEGYMVVFPSKLQAACRRLYSGAETAEGFILYIANEARNANREEEKHPEQKRNKNLLKLIGATEKRYSEYKERKASNALKTIAFNLTAEDVREARALSQQAEAAKGNFRDSAQYKKLKKEIDFSKELVTRLYEGGLNKNASLKLKDFPKAARERLARLADEKGMIAMDVLYDEYRASRSNIRKFATEYEEYKLVSFTRDPKDKSGKKQLDRSGKAKFELVDTILGRKKDAMVKDGKQNQM